MSPLFVQVNQIINKRDYLQQVLSQPCSWGRENCECPLRGFRHHPDMAQRMTETEVIRLLKTHLEHHL